MIAQVILLLVDRPRIFLFDCLQTFFFKTRGQTGHFLSILFSSFSFRFRVCSVLLHPLCPDDRGVSSRGCIRCPILFLSRWAFDRWNENGITSDDSTKTILGLRCNSKWAIPFHWNECERTMKHKLISKQTIVFFFWRGGEISKSNEQNYNLFPHLVSVFQQLTKQYSSSNVEIYVKFEMSSTIRLC